MTVQQMLGYSENNNGFCNYNYLSMYMMTYCVFFSFHFFHFISFFFCVLVYYV